MIKINEEIERFIKIGDFGLIAIHKFVQQLHTEKRGHNRYAAPEVLNGKMYDTKADIYSLGMVLINLFDIDMNWYSNYRNSIKFLDINIYLFFNFQFI